MHVTMKKKKTLYMKNSRKIKNKKNTNNFPKRFHCKLMSHLNVCRKRPRKRVRGFF